MKNIIKLVSFIILIVTLGCENSDGRFTDNPASGWVEFRSGQTQTSLRATNVSIQVDVNVPVYPEGLNISYILEAVEGDFSPFVQSNSGTLYVDPTNDYRYVNAIDIPLINTDGIRTSDVKFNVVLTGVNASGVSVGVDATSIVKHTVIIPCTPAQVLASDAFLGEYMLTVPSGPSLFGVNLFDEQIVTLTATGAGNLSRTFDARYLPFYSASPETMIFTVTDGNIIVGLTPTSTGCSSAIQLNGNPNNIITAPCDDEEIVLNMLDFYNGSGGCGVSNVPVQLKLTKV